MLFLLDPIKDNLADLGLTFLRYKLFLTPLLLFIEEAGLPLPIPGDIILAYVGYRVARGDYSLFLALLFFPLTITLGASVLYCLSCRWGQNILLKLGHYLVIDKNKIKMVEVKFRRHGLWVIILGRQLSILRTAITFFAGSAKLKYSVFALSVFIAAFIWSAFYIFLGMMLGPQVMDLVRRHFHTMPLFLIIPVTIFTFFYLKNRKHKKKQTV